MLVDQSTLDDAGVFGLSDVLQDGTVCALHGDALVATYREAEDLINIGAYVKGSNPMIDLAIAKMGPLNEFFRQGIYEYVPHDDAVQKLSEILNS